MEIKIDSELQNPVLKRKEVRFTVLQDAATLSRADLEAELCKKLSANPENSIVVEVNQKFGEKVSTGIFRIYESKAAMEALEPKHILLRAKKIEEKPKEKKEKPVPAAKQNEGGAAKQAS